jgi:hypothetical protein
MGIISTAPAGGFLVATLISSSSSSSSSTSSSLADTGVGFPVAFVGEGMGGWQNEERKKERKTRKVYLAQTTSKTLKKKRRAEKKGVKELNREGLIDTFLCSYVFIDSSSSSFLFCFSFGNGRRIKHN